MEKSSLSSQNFNQSLVKILSIHKTNWIKKKKAKETKCDRRRLREIVKDFAKMEERLKRFRGRSGKTLWKVNSDQHFFIHSLTSEETPALNPILSRCKWSPFVFCWVYEARPLCWHYSSNYKWSLSLISRSFFPISSLRCKRFINWLWDCAINYIIFRVATDIFSFFLFFLLAIFVSSQ